MGYREFEGVRPINRIRIYTIAELLRQILEAEDIAIPAYWPFHYDTMRKSTNILATRKEHTVQVYILEVSASSSAQTWTAKSRNMASCTITRCTHRSNP